MFNTHGGAVLATTIDKYCYVMLHDGKSWFTFDLPNKSGLASSSAYTVGLLRACTELDKVTIAKLATTWEQDKMNGAVGSQDQYLCAVGGFHYLRFSEHGIRDTMIDCEVVKPLESYLMLFDTHQYRVNSEIIPAQLKEMEQHEELYKQMAEMPGEGVNLLRSGNFLAFGNLLGKSWQLKKDVAPKATTPAIDRIYETALTAGAVGGKLLGGGGGGFIIFVVKPEDQDNVRRVLGELTHVPFRFESEGSRVIYRD